MLTTYWILCGGAGTIGCDFLTPVPITSQELIAKIKQSEEQSVKRASWLLDIANRLKTQAT